MNTLLKRPYSPPPSQQIDWLNFHCCAWMVLVLLCLNLGLVIGSHQKAFGEMSDRQENGLASIATPKGSIIFAEVADTPDKRAQGLMYRTAMKSDQGMLFLFPELGYWTFWMKNTKIPLDILWLDNKGTIIHIESNVPICTRVDDHCPRYYSYKQSWQVLELNGGVAEKLQLIPGNRLTISLPPQNHIPS
jgi:uncharacterized membrane protein (UPF0127 family)